ncbi:MAG TPA: hypothetical protein DCS66_18885, partial [Flavobacteriaceae bacterium]|nr:hypothetical protein [Flavobacteriaceae bacterium]
MANFVIDFSFEKFFRNIKRLANIQFTKQGFKKKGPKKLLEINQKQEKPYHCIATLIWLLVNRIVTNQSLRLEAGLLYPCGCD